MATVIPALCSEMDSLLISNFSEESATYPFLLDGSGGNFGQRLPDNLFSLAQSNGQDCCITSDAAGLNQLPMEIVSFNAAGRTCEIWVAVTLPASTSVTIYLWYASKVGTLTQPAASGSYGSQAVWTAVGNMTAVYHMGSSGTLSTNDSTANSLTGTNTGCSASSGRIGGAALLNGTSNFIQSSGTVIAPANITLQSWIYPTALNFRGVVSLGNSSDEIAELLYGGNLACLNQGGSNAAATSFSASSSWSHVAGTATAAGVTQFLNGVQKATAAFTTSLSGKTVDVCVGQRQAGVAGWWFSGLIDEIRIHSVARSANWLATDYAIQSSTSLVTVGTPKPTGGLFRPSALSGIGSGGPFFANPLNCSIFDPFRRIFRPRKKRLWVPGFSIAAA